MIVPFSDPVRPSMRAASIRAARLPLAPLATDPGSESTAALPASCGPSSSRATDTAPAANGSSDPPAPPPGRSGRRAIVTRPALIASRATAPRRSAVACTSMARPSISAKTPPSSASVTLLVPSQNGGHPDSPSIATVTPLPEAARVMTPATMPCPGGVASPTPTSTSSATRPISMLRRACRMRLFLQSRSAQKAWPRPT
jgi:hypothetical protein